jgi:ectoine hydroxylase-related dioxygenase (phytanoyl-CoA dioxygenase family)
VLTTEQLAEYHRDGFLVLKGQISEGDICRLEQGFRRNPPLDGTLYDTRKLSYPEPGRYTLANNCLKDPDLAFLAEHDQIVPAAAEVLGAEPKLSAFVIYDRTPQGSGLPSHNDYKRWRPVGSSMNWVFTTIPFCDFDQSTGQLLVAPGSHHTERIHRGLERPLEVEAPTRPSEDSYIDPELKRGDLLLMNMHLWHRANGNTSNSHRIGAFNKYAAANAPPATGWFLYDDQVNDALSPTGRSVLARHSNKTIDSTRLLLVRESNDREVLLLTDPQGRLALPGGPTFTEKAIADWDAGNYIAALQAAVRDQLRIETPWVSYVGDFPEGDGLCRVYAYTLNGLGFPVQYTGAEWMDRQRLQSAKPDLLGGWEIEALDLWVDDEIIRGKGLTQAQCRVNQYAY